MSGKTVIQSRRQAWDVIFSDPNLSVQSLQQRAVSGTVCENGLRSVCWKVYLGYLPDLNVSTWPSILTSERKRYADLRRQYIDEPAEEMTKKSDNLTDNNPLALNESNPWQQYFADSEIRKVIRQDVDRTFPDIDFFRIEAVQEKMTDILFIYCKIHHEISYRQGMHELLAPFYWNIATESLQGASFEDIDACSSDPTNRLMAQVLDSTFIEHDTFLLFDRLMSFAKPWYEFNNTAPAPPLAKSLNRRSKSAMDLTVSEHTNTQQSAHLNPVVDVCQRIHHKYLRLVDPPLYNHLESFGIEPQLFGIRWLRLLFGREFEFHELLRLWDALFAEDRTLKIVEFVCVAILLRLHDQLIENDYAECLTLLMRGTRISNPITLVKQAKSLQENLSHDGALQILRQNDVRAGKEPRASLWKNELETGALHEQHSDAYQRKSQGSNLDITNITRGVMKSNQVRDLNKTIAGVMGAVHKNVNLFGDNVLGRNTTLDGQAQRRRLTVPSEFPDGIDRVAPGTHYYKPSPSLPRSSSISNMQRASPGTAKNANHDSNSTALATLQKVNRQMGNLMAQCVDVLEKELFSKQSMSASSSAAYINSTATTPISPIAHNSTIATNATTTTTTTLATEVSEADDTPNATSTTPSGIEDSISASETAKDSSLSDAASEIENLRRDTRISSPRAETATNATSQGRVGFDEASVMLALAGLKHIRDVLQGRQLQFDSNVLSLELSSTSLSASSSKDTSETRLDEETLARHSDIIRKPLPEIQQQNLQRPSPQLSDLKREHQDHSRKTESAYIFFDQDQRPLVKRENPDATFVQISQVLDEKWNDLSDAEKKVYMDKESIEVKSESLPSDPEVPVIDSAMTASTPSPPRPTTSSKPISVSRAPMKQQVTYSIEDLLSDPALQSRGSGTQRQDTNSQKFRWMVDGEGGKENSENTNNDSEATSLFHDTDTLTSSTPDAVTSQPLPLGHHRPTSRQRSSVTLNKSIKSPVKVETSINHVDPLDAKNVDKRYSYEYDIYQ